MNSGIKSETEDITAVRQNASEALSSLSWRANPESELHTSSY